MNSLLKRSSHILIIVCAGLALFMSGVQAKAPLKDVVPQTQDPPNELKRANTSQPEAGQPTQEELKAAQPLPLPEYVMPPGAAVSPQTQSLPAGAVPGYSEGWVPQSGLPQPDPMNAHTLVQDNLIAQLGGNGSEPQTFSVAPTNPLNGPYAPFQRWTWFGNYVAQETQMVGILFIDTDNNGSLDSWCTASTIGTETIATAAHCLHSGGPSGHFYYNWVYCPSYYAGGVYPTRGCWG